MTRMTGPDCAVMCNLINIHTCIHRMTRMTGSDCAVTCNLIIYLHRYKDTYIDTCIVYIDTYMSRLIRGFRNKYH